MRKYENRGNAKFGGLMKELGFLFVTQIQVSEVGLNPIIDYANRGRTQHLSPLVGTLPEILNLVVPPLFRKLLHFA